MVDRRERFGVPRVEVDRIVRHMNFYHRAESLAIVRSWGDGGSSVESCWVTGFDADGIDFLAEAPDGPRVVRLDFRTSVSCVDEVAAEIRRLHARAARASESGQRPSA